MYRAQIADHLGKFHDEGSGIIRGAGLQGIGG